MAYNFVNYLRNITSYSVIDTDLRDSKEIVNTLSVPESTKTFVFAIKVPEHDSTIHILSAQSLSLRSVIDAECLIRELRPDALVVQVDGPDFGEESQEIDDGSNDSIPTSAFKVLTRCIVDKTFDKDKYESVAGNLVLKEIFGTSFKGHALAAKKVAEEVGSSFMVLKSPFITEGLSKSLTRQYYYGSAISSYTRFQITNDARALMLKLLSSHITQLRKELSPSSCLANEKGSDDSVKLPEFAYSIYNLLVDLHNIFNGLPAIRKALDSARKMLSDVNRGESIDKALLSEVYLFRIAVEGIRIALNNSGRLPIRNLGHVSNQTQVQFSKLSSMEKSYALMADSLRDQAKKFKNIVAVVDAGNLKGLRRHWRTCVPQEVKDMSTKHSALDCNANASKLKPIVAVGAGALRLTKAIASFKALAPLRLFLSNTQEAMSLSKATLPVETISLTQYILDSAQVTSFCSVQATLYGIIMRRRRAKPIGTLPMAMFGASLATCAGLLFYEKGIMCAAATLPSAHSIAKLGHGIKNLREVSEEVKRRENKRIQNTLEGLSERLRNFRLHYSLSFSFTTKFGS
ncbi:unnamed protein product [Eruca vesicaria subsp. sativa]|uniref:Uncharacterized protein n=1 Tax=Eruca vesicaria subsp. sativa TaxID=29727 RepID=A0ABC8J5L8_ERUVS|nr:unnamed protein product [Eruca vesicaria subsp. sativa]